MNILSIKSKNDTIDPLSTIIKLYILTFKGEKTKIFIYNNRLNVNTFGSFQGITRFYYQANKNDITILIMPILYACNHYLLLNKEKYLFLFEQAIIGFNKLKSTYEGDEITHNIDSLISTIKEYINTNTNVVNAVYNTESGQLKQAFYNSISRVWTEERLEILFNILNQIKNETIHINSLVHILESYMNFIDEKVHDMISGLI